MPSKLATLLWATATDLAMPITFNIPSAVKAVAAEALQLHYENSLEGVGGVKIAEALASGVVDVSIVAKMHRFFVVNERHYLAEASLSHRPTTSPLMRSWSLHGGHAGKTWSNVVYADAVKSGFVDEDQWVTLLRSKPEQVYEALSMGAWRWEYDMDPQRAARFVEEYHRSTGLNLDIAKAFGSSRNAVSLAMMRRAQNDNPFKIIARNLLRREYKDVAADDMREMKQAIGRPALNWPSVVGVVALGSRKPELMRSVVEGYPAPPLLGRAPLPLMAYSEPVASYVAYFHPKGCQFVGNMPPGLLAEMHTLITNVHAYKQLDETVAREVLERARTWTGNNALAWNVGHLLLEAWRNEDWALFLEALPLDSPVRTPFERFVGVKSRP